MTSPFSTKCWNCGSNDFVETVSREYCPNCKIECLYHGNGANQIYNDAHSRKNKEAKEKWEKYWDEYYAF